MFDAIVLSNGCGDATVALQLLSHLQDDGCLERGIINTDAPPSLHSPVVAPMLHMVDL